MATPRFNFVINCSNPELTDYLQMEIDANPCVFNRSDLEWCLQTYLILKQRKNLQVACSNHLLKNAINIVHSAQLLTLAEIGECNHSYFIVCVQADFPKRRWAHFHLVQNKNQIRANNALIPFWVQPALIKRSPDRRSVRRVAYAGQTFNGNLAGTTETWKNLLEPYGFEFVVLPKETWNDLSTIDVLIGIRSFDTNPYNTKPPSKLINAWHAQIPFIGGNDSAFRQVGTPGEDYLLAITPQEIVNAILRLRDEAELYAKLVKNGQQKAQQYTSQTIAEVWENILTGPVYARYEQWKSRSVYERIRFNTLLKIGLLEHKSKQLIKKSIIFRSYKKLNSKK